MAMGNDHNSNVSSAGSKNVLIGVGIGIGFAAWVGGLYLLYLSKFSGSEFVAFVTVFSIIGLIVCLLKEVSEFSVGGNIVKFREVKKDAENAIEAVKRTQVELLRFFLRSKVFLNFNYSFDPEHLSIEQDFWDLCSEIRRSNCVEELRSDLLFKINSLKVSQFGAISSWSGGVHVKSYSDYDSYESLVVDVLNSSFLKEVTQAKGEEHESTFSNFVKGRLSELKRLIQLEEEISSEKITSLWRTF